MSKASREPAFTSFGHREHPTVVFLSGIYLGPEIYSRLLRAVARRGFYVVGLPTVTNQTADFETPSQVAQDFWARIDALYEANVLRSPLAAVAGHSAGGWLSIAAAKERPESAPGIVLVNASAGEDYNLAMKRRLKAASDITRQVFVSLGYGASSVYENWVRISAGHRHLTRMMEKFVLDDDLNELSNREFFHSQVIYTDRDYLVTEVGVSAQEAALKKPRTLLPGHHGSCIPDGKSFGSIIGDSLRENTDLFTYLGVQPGPNADHSLS